MIIRHFAAKKVHGIYDFDFEFFEDITFLVGINGSGKTSALRLMQAALSLDLQTLSTIKFTSLKIDVEKEGISYSLKINQKQDHLNFWLNDRNLIFAIPATLSEIKSYEQSKLDDIFENQRVIFLKEGGDFISKFVTGVRPLFLGLERRMGRYDEDQFAIEFPSQYHRFNDRRVRRGAIEGLDNCQRLIERAFKQYRRINDGAIDRLINIIVESTFEYLEFDPDQSFSAPQAELEEMQQRRMEIEAFANRLGRSSKIDGVMDRFFDKLSSLAKNDKHPEGMMSIEWLLNMAQIKRIRNILTEMDRQKKTAEKHYAPIKEFTSSMNEFLKFSRKEIQIDPLGRITAQQAGKPVDISWLSSGEKQLLILLAHARFGFTKRSSFIVDEPELSLHLRWQEMLVDALFESGKGNQFIFATHSPEIVGFRTRHCIEVS